MLYLKAMVRELWLSFDLSEGILVFVLFTFYLSTSWDLKEDSEQKVSFSFILTLIFLLSSFFLLASFKLLIAQSQK